MGNGLSSRMTDPAKCMKHRIVRESDLSKIVSSINNNLPLEISMTAKVDEEKFKEFLEHKCTHNYQPIKDILCSGEITCYGIKEKIVIFNNSRFTYMYTTIIQGTIQRTKLEIKCICGESSDITKYNF